MALLLCIGNALVKHIFDVKHALLLLFAAVASPASFRVILDLLGAAVDLLLEHRGLGWGGFLGSGTIPPQP
eukprot:10203886-Prorocentrum_lima.AAC.1